jgi:predicted dehydrogenase
MKILMIGLGSIGQRHVRNIRRILGNDVELIAFRERGLSRTFSDDMKIRENITLEEEFSITSFTNLDEALDTKPDIVFITNITAKHVEYSIKSANAGCDLFLEKPLSDNLNRVDELSKIVKDKGLIAFMGFQNRYHPALLQLKKDLDKNLHGNTVAVNIEIGERLTTMHNYENYAETYMARTDMGGGVVLNQQIHEIDYANWLFGKPDSVYSLGGKAGELEIDVEDNSSSIYTVKKGNKSFPVYIHSDFFQFPPTRKCKVIGDKGIMEVDLIANKYTWIENDKIYTTHYEDFQRNNMFIEELKDFFYSVKNRTNPQIPLEEGITSLKIALATKEAMKTNSIVKINI